MNEFEISMVNKPSVFEPLKFYCSLCFDTGNFCFITYTIIIPDHSVGSCKSCWWLGTQCAP